MLGKIFWIFLAVFAALGAVGFVMARLRAKKGEKGDGLPDHGIENMADLNDRFNRARYMNRETEKDTEKEDK